MKASVRQDGQMFHVTYTDGDWSSMEIWTREEFTRIADPPWDGTPQDARRLLKDRCEARKQHDRGWQKHKQPKLSEGLQVDV